jgi:hypothetical protein
MSLTQHPDDARPASPAPRGPRFWQRLSFYGLLALVGITAASAAYQQQPATPQGLPQAAPTPMDSSPAPVANAASPMDEPIRLITLARQAYQGVRDYACLMIKQERIDGRLGPEETILMKVRTAPFSVYFHWQAPPRLAGQEACYVAGRNNGMMRARAKGLLGAVGFVSLNPNDPRARANSRHAITEAGIGNLIEQFARGWANERQWGQTQVNVGQWDFDRRRCTRVETIHPNAAGGRFLHYRDVVYFDNATHLIIRMEAYNWPRRAGDPGELDEAYSYAHLQLNVGLGDEVFNH